jgi:hypothetical protein
MFRVIEQLRIWRRFYFPYIFAKADDVTIRMSTTSSQDSLLRFLQVKGREKESIDSFHFSRRELNKIANANEKQSSNNGNVRHHESKTGMHASKMVQNEYKEYLVLNENKGYKKN